MVHILPVHASRGTARCRVPLGVKMGITIVGQLLCLLLENQKERYFCQVQGSSGGEGRFEMRPSTFFAWNYKKRSWFLHSPQLQWSADRWDSKSASKLGFRVCTGLRRSERKKSQAEKWYKTQYYAGHIYVCRPTCWQAWKSSTGTSSFKRRLPSVNDLRGVDAPPLYHLCVSALPHRCPDTKQRQYCSTGFITLTATK